MERKEKEEPPRRIFGGQGPAQESSEEYEKDSEDEEEDEKITNRTSSRPMMERNSTPVLCVNTSSSAYAITMPLSHSRIRIRRR